MPPHPLVETKQGTRVRSYMADTPSAGKDGMVRNPNDQMKSQRFQNGSQEGRRSGPALPSGPASSSGNVGEQQQHAPQQRRRVTNMAQQQGAANQMMGGYGGGMMPMGMGMGMGYGGYGGYGMGYGMGGMMGPMGMIYSINYFIATISQFAGMLGMGTQAVSHLLQMAREQLLKLEKTVRQSELRRWLQRKSQKSPLFRWALVIVSMLAASQVVRLARYLIEVQMRRTGTLIGNGIGGTQTSNTSSALVPSTASSGALSSGVIGQDLLGGAW